MANADNPKGFEPYRLGSDPSGHQIEEFQVNVSQTIARGDAVILSSGKVSIAVSTSPQILGVAAEAKTTGGTVTSSDVIKVYVAKPGALFVGRASGDSALTLIGTEADIEGATGAMEINENASVEDVVRIVAIHPSDVVGTNGRVIFHWIRSSWLGYVADQT